MKSYNGFEPAQRLRALAWLKKQYAAGTRSRPLACDACGQDVGIVENHSEDYSEPFGDNVGAYAFCFTCHMLIHCRFSAPAAWAAYRQAVAEGATFPPFFTRNFGAIKATFLQGRFPQPASRPPPARRVLDEINDGLGRGVAT